MKESSGTIIAMACEALRKRRCLAVSYHGFARVVEVHVVGRTREGVEIMRSWQVSGGSEGGCAAPCGGCCAPLTVPSSASAAPSENAVRRTMTAPFS